MSIVVTGATGHLGRHVVEQLLEKVPAEQVTAVVRTPEKAADFAAKGLPHQSFVLPCGHYSTGVSPFKWVDGYVLTKFLHDSLVKDGAR